MDTVTPSVASNTTNTTGDWQTQILLSGYLTTMIFGASLGILGIISLCRRVKKVHQLHIYFYHILVLEMFQNVIILNMKAMILLGEISSASFYTLNIVDYSLSGITMLTLTLNMADIFYRTGRQSDVGLLVQRRNFLYAFIALWLWCGGVICLPPTTMVTLVYHGENYQYLWDISDSNTWMFTLIAVLIITLLSPLTAIIAISLRICWKSRPGNQVGAVLKHVPRNCHPSQQRLGAWSEEKPNRATKGVIAHAALLGLSQAGLLILVLSDTTLIVSPYSYNWCILSARMCAVLGMYCQIFSDRALKEELAIGLKCVPVMSVTQT